MSVRVHDVLFRGAGNTARSTLADATLSQPGRMALRERIAEIAEA